MSECRPQSRRSAVIGRYFDETSSINFRRSVVYGLSTLSVLVKYWANRLHVVKSPLFQPQAG